MIFLLLCKNIWEKGSILFYSRTRTSVFQHYYGTKLIENTDKSQKLSGGYQLP